MPNESVTPMMRQYLEIRRTLPRNTILLFRLGDFYEMFEDDAVQGARVLGITLTKRHQTPMAGIPFHAGDTYIARLLEAGFKVAICEQTESAKTGKLVNRSVVRILTPGTTLESNRLDNRHNHYLLALAFQSGKWCFSWLDLSTGAFQIAAGEAVSDTLPLLYALDAKEIVLPESLHERWQQGGATQEEESLASFVRSIPNTELPDYQFDPASGAQAVKDALGVLSLDGFGIRPDHLALGVAGALVIYATEMLCSKPQNLHTLREYRTGGALLIDPATQRNLEVFRASDGKRKGSLLEAMDQTVTSPGARLLEQYLSAPSLDIKEIQRRQGCVEACYQAKTLGIELINRLKTIHDIPRILGRLKNNIKNPRELGAIRVTLQTLPSLKETLALFHQPEIAAIADRMHLCTTLREGLDAALNPELPSDIREGGVIRPGFDFELDRLRSLNSGNKAWISDLEQSERERTGIKNLKVRFNGAFGYFIEITKSNLNQVPPDYIRKQTMVNAERFSTEDLKRKEREIFHAEEMSLGREESLFRGLVESAGAEAASLYETASAIAELDVFLGWALIAREWNYCKPELVEDRSVLAIDAGRHPVIEHALREQPQGLAGAHAFVPNDCRLSADQEQIALITGPNMAGKSTYIRQNALIALMAHVGSWVPATRCTVGLVDRIFSRVGASDELARGNSTFMVEMNETANILNHATPRSLIILDEIGRGTSTYDGLSIAWSVVEYLHGERDAGPMTLFATHYHEITQLAQSLPRLKNLCVAVKEWNDQIIFVRQVIEGAADRSYGIQVARLAGIPAPVIERAKFLLARLEAASAQTSNIHQPVSVKTSSTREITPKSPKIDMNQLSLFGE